MNCATLSSIVAAALVAFAAPDTCANCWQDIALAQRAQQLARERFPDVSSRMPELLICDQHEFMPNVAGDYSGGGGVHRIRVSSRELHSGNLDSILLHEIGHAAVALRGEAHNEYGGHGLPWLRAMVGAGLAAEAERVSAANGSWAELQQATGATGGQRGWAGQPPNDGLPPAWGPGAYAPPQRWQPRVRCFDVPVMVQRVTRHGHIIFHQQWQRQCTAGGQGSRVCRSVRPQCPTLGFSGGKLGGRPSCP